jgi:hypothetical protein
MAWPLQLEFSGAIYRVFAVSGSCRSCDPAYEAFVAANVRPDPGAHDSGEYLEYPTQNGIRIPFREKIWRAANGLSPTEVVG